MYLSDSSKEYKSLAIWSTYMRSAYNGKGNGKITKDRILRLEANFKWILGVQAAVEEEAPVLNLDDSDDDFGNGLMDRLKCTHKAQSLLLLQNLSTPKSADHLAFFLIAMRQKTLSTLVH